MAYFDDVQVEVRKDSDGSYLFHVFIGEESPLRRLMLCPGDYPITGPELDLYDEFYQKCEPVDSRILEDWSFY